MMKDITFTLTDREDVVLIDGHRWIKTTVFQTGRFYQCVRFSTVANMGDVIVIGEEPVILTSRLVADTVGDKLRLADLNQENEAWQEINLMQFTEICEKNKTLETE